MSKRAIFLLAAFHLLLATAAPAAKPDAPGCKDPSLFPVRMPKYSIQKCEYKPFASYNFFTSNPRQQKTVEGEFTYLIYQVENREDDRSGAEVIQNYENAFRKIGGRIEASDPAWRFNGVVTIDGREVWTEVQKGNGVIWLRIVRRQEMKQTVVADAASFANDLKVSGHVAVGGIYFDTASAKLKPESAAAVAQIAKLLQSDAGLKLYVVGHTDTVGNVEANLKLSRDRAEAVVQSLVAGHGIVASRLRAFGNGPFAPVASNASDEGRALNRRVELVKQ